MGNQVSSKKKKPAKSVTNSTTSRTFADSFNNNHSTVSSNQPKFATEIYPKTAIEASRQKGEHYLLKHVFQQSYFAPIDTVLSKPGSTCLDIGCGTHAPWLIDVANDFPNCTFYGFDITEPFSLDADNAHHIPSNCKLKKHDLFDGFGYQDNTFDFTHQRTMHSVYNSDKITWMFNELIRVTKHNGWIELVEPDIVPKRAGPIFSSLMSGVRRSFRSRRGGSILQSNMLVEKMIESGLVDVKSDYGSVPVCWGGYIGKLVYEDMLQMLRQAGPMIYEFLDFEEEYNQDAYEALIDSAFDECVEHQTFFNVRWVYGKKPAAK